MRILSIKYLSWVSLVGAVLMWAGVVYFALIIGDAETERTLRQADSAQADMNQEAFLKTHTLARDTKDARARLEALVDTDINEILDEIEAVGADVGVRIEISQASAGSSSTREAPLSTTNFIVSSEGSFAKLSQVAALLESLRTPSVIDELQFERIESANGKTPPWRLVVRLRVFTVTSLPI